MGAKRRHRHLAWGWANRIRSADAGAGNRRGPRPLTTLDGGATQTIHRNPSFLPDGRRFLYQSVPDGVFWVGSLDGGEPTKLLIADAGVQFAPPDWLLFVRQNTLLAQRVDLSRLKMLGEPRQIAEDVRTNEMNGRSAFTVSSNGVLVYRTGDQSQEGLLTWFDRSGKIVGTVTDSAARYQAVRLFPMSVTR